MRKRKMNNKGISLIVLIITIIVMIILAGAIILYLNNTNIFDKAKQAVNATNEKQLESLTQKLWAEAYLDGAKTDAEFEEYILEGLEGIDTSNYLIIATTSGVEVEDKANWEFGYAYSNNTWSEKILKGNTLEGDITAKFYKAGEIPDNQIDATWTIPAGEAYRMLIEGTGEIEPLRVESEDVEGDYEYFAWQYDMILWESGENDKCDMIYVTDVIIEDGITNIPEAAFMFAVNLRRIIIPNSVTSIGDEAFSACHTLENIILPNSVTSIGSYAFYDCARLSSIKMPNSLTTIGDFAFMAPCMHNITIPSSVTSIGAYAFIGNLQNDIVINYLGTEQQFNAIDKDEYWIDGFKSITYNFAD